MRKFFKALRYLFLFRKPVFTQLDFVDLVIDEKPIFLISWQISRGYKLKVKPISKYYKMRDGALLLRLRQGIDSVEIIASNLWRTRKLKIALKQTGLDADTANLLIQQFKPLSTVHINHYPVTLKQKLSHVIKSTVQINPLKVHSSKKLTVKREMFTYNNSCL